MSLEKQMSQSLVSPVTAAFALFVYLVAFIFLLVALKPDLPLSRLLLGPSGRMPRSSDRWSRHRSLLLWKSAGFFCMGTSYMVVANASSFVVGIGFGLAAIACLSHAIFHEYKLRKA